MVFRLHGRQSEIEGRQKCKHIGLDKGNQQFKQIHKYHKSHGDHRNPESQRGADGAENKNKAYETKCDDMPCGDVGKETDHQDKGFGDDPDDLNDRHQGNGKFQPPGHPGGVDNVDPVMFVTVDGGENEGENRHDQGDRDIPGYIGTPRKKGDQTEKVVEKDKKEHRKQEGHELLIFFLPDGASGNVIADKDDQRFHQRLQSAGSLIHITPVSIGNRKKDQDQQQGAQENRKGNLGDRKVINRRTRYFVIVLKPGDLSLARPFGSYLKAMVAVVLIVEPRGAEEKKFAVVQEDDGQRNGEVEVSDLGYMPFMVVDHMFHDHFPGIKFPGLPGFGFCRVAGNAVGGRDEHGMILCGGMNPAHKQEHKQEAEERIPEPVQV